MDETLANHNVTLLDLLDRVIDNGVVIQGDLRISVADIDLIYISLRLFVSSISKIRDSADADLLGTVVLPAAISPQTWAGRDSLVLNEP